MARVTAAQIQAMKAENRKIVALTAYYYEMARIIDRAEPDIILVGDSGGRFLLGHEDNNDVTLQEMMIMTRSVCRGAEHALVVGDLPFMSYQVSVEKAVANAGWLMKESRCNAVKLEGGAEFAPAVEQMVRVGIPVLGHMGRTPMTSAALGGMRSNIQLDEEKVWNDARALQDAGAFAVILTGLNPDLAARITKGISIPTISGFGSGDECDGDIGISPGTLGWGLNELDSPRARYGPVAKTIFEAASSYIKDVRERKPVRSGR